ncbi:MAG: exosortase-associated EpsI family protein [Planctomycetales bacterium]|nr:exosortase-associated EpsI family protein [Planctomycetales bacterium]
MTRGSLPLIFAAVLIGVLTFVEGYFMKDRWGSPSLEAGKLGERFDNVPKEIGQWIGQDLPVEEIVQKTAGAVSYVSRNYTHTTTGKQVKLWLIVGHSRDIVRHTPQICYPASGFRQQGPRLRHHIETADGKEAVFFTAKFEKEDAFSHQIERVFWAWNHPDHDQWDAPESSSGRENARFHYGLARALYKMYFTTTVMNNEETVDDSAAAEFAKLMLPAVDAALFPKQSPADSETEGSAEEGIVEQPGEAG